MCVQVKVKMVEEMQFDRFGGGSGARWSLQSSFRVKKLRMLLRSASEDPSLSRLIFCNGF